MSETTQLYKESISSSFRKRSTSAKTGKGVEGTKVQGPLKRNCDFSSEDAFATKIRNNKVTKKAGKREKLRVFFYGLFLLFVAFVLVIVDWTNGGLSSIVLDPALDYAFPLMNDPDRGRTIVSMTDLHLQRFHYLIGRSCIMWFDFSRCEFVIVLIYLMLFGISRFDLLMTLKLSVWVEYWKRELSITLTIIGTTRVESWVRIWETRCNHGRRIYDWDASYLPQKIRQHNQVIDFLNFVLIQILHVNLWPFSGVAVLDS